MNHFLLSLTLSAICLIAMASCRDKATSKSQNKTISQPKDAKTSQADSSTALQFIDIEEPDTEGKNHRLSEYVGRGNYVLIDFWASWCPPCRAEMPNLVAAYAKYHSKGFDIVGLSLDNDAAAWQKAISEMNLTWHHLSDLKGWDSLAAETYQLESIPASLLVDPQGRIIASNLRGEALGQTLAKIYK